MPAEKAGFSFASMDCIEIYTILMCCFCAFWQKGVKLYENKYNFKKKAFCFAD